MHEVLRTENSPDMVVEWSLLDRDPMLPTVVLHDRLMTDAALGNLPIKTEHSYSLSSDGESLQDSDNLAHTKIGELLPVVRQRYLLQSNAESLIGVIWFTVKKNRNNGFRV